MRWLAPLGLLMVMIGATGCHQSGAGVRVYVQTVCGDNRDTPPGPEAKPIGARLDERLREVFKYEHYWEMRREEVALREGRKTRRRVDNGREVELELLRGGSLAIRIYNHAKLTQHRTQPAEAAFAIAGGPATGNESWFVVVRRDVPAPPEIPSPRPRSTPANWVARP